MSSRRDTTPPLARVPANDARTTLFAAVGKELSRVGPRAETGTSVQSTLAQSVGGAARLDHLDTTGLLRTISVAFNVSVQCSALVANARILPCSEVSCKAGTRTIRLLSHGVPASHWTEHGDDVKTSQPLH